MSPRLILLAATVVGLLGPVAGAHAASRPFTVPFAIGRTDQVAAEGAQSLHTAGDGRGDLAIAWTNTHRRGTESLEVAVRAVGGRLRRARTDYTVTGTLGQPAVAMDGRGDAVVAFTRFTAAGRERAVMVIDVSRSGHAGRATRVSPPGVPCEEPAVAAAPGGGFAVAFQRDGSARGGDDAGQTPEDVMVTRRPVGGRFGTATAISAPVDPAAAKSVGYLVPSLAADRHGTFVAAWFQPTTPVTNASSTGVEQLATTDGSSFGPPVSVGFSEEFGQSLAVDPAGDVLLTWTGADGALVASARAATPGAAFSAPVGLTNVGVPGETNLNGTATALTPSGRGLALWTDGGGDQPGTLGSVSAPPGGPVGSPVDVPAHPTVGSRGAFPPSTADPSSVQIGTRTLVAWQEIALQTDGREESGSNSLVTLEYAVGPDPAALGPGRLLLDASYPARLGQLTGSTLVGGGSGRTYLVFVEDSGTVSATRLIRAR